MSSSDNIGTLKRVVDCSKAPDKTTVKVKEHGTVLDRTYTDLSAETSRILEDGTVMNTEMTISACE